MIYGYYGKFKVTKSKPKARKSAKEKSMYSINFHFPFGEVATYTVYGTQRVVESEARNLQKIYEIKPVRVTIERW